MLSTICCPQSSAEPNLQPKTKKQLFCLDRNEQEQFVECIEQNMVCHETVRRMAKAESRTDWTWYAIAIAEGAALGLVIANQMHH